MYSNVMTLGGWTEVGQVVTVARGAENVIALLYNLRSISPASRPWLAQCWESRDEESVSAQMSRARGRTEVAAARSEGI